MLELHGTDVVETRVSPLPVVPHFDECEGHLTGLSARRPVVVGDQLVLQHVEAALRHGIDAPMSVKSPSVIADYRTLAGVV